MKEKQVSKKQKTFFGKVVSTKQKDTAVIEVESYWVHPIYETRRKRTKRYSVHAPLPVTVGDVVDFYQTRPMSKTKKWIITAPAAKKGDKKK